MERTPSWSTGSDFVTKAISGLMSGLIAGIVIGILQTSVAGIHYAEYDPSLWIFYSVYTALMRVSTITASFIVIAETKPHIVYVSALISALLMLPYLLPIRNAVGQPEAPYAVAALVIVFLTVISYFTEKLMSNLWIGPRPAFDRLRVHSIGKINMKFLVAVLAPAYFGVFGMYYHIATGIHSWTIITVIVYMTIYNTMLLLHYRGGSSRDGLRN